MSFLVPQALWLLLAVPVLILAYIIKTQHEERHISSTFIWKRSERLIKKKMPWQILRRSILFVLQLLTVIAIALIASRPTMQIKGKGEEYILIIDGSASMKTATDGVTRFDRAIDQAVDLADDMGYGNKATVIYTGDKTSYMINRSDSAVQVVNVLESLICSDYAADFDNALSLARLIQQENEYAKIFYYTDKNYEETSDVTVVNVAYENEWNVAVQGLSATNEDGVTVFMSRVVSYGQDASLTAALYVDGQVVAAKQIDCKAGESKDVYWTPADMAAPVTYGKFSTAEIYLEAEDGNTGDNRFCLCTSRESKTSVMLISEQPVFLNSLLSAFGNYDVTTFPSVEEALYSLADHSDPEAELPVVLSGSDLYIFDGVCPAVMPNDGAIWLFGVKEFPETVGLTISPDAETVKITDEEGNEVDTGMVAGAYLAFAKDTESDAYATMTQYYEPANIAVQMLYPYAAEGWEPILTCRDWPAVLVPTEYDKRMVVFAFDIHDSNLPLLVEYPELFGNMAQYCWPVSLPKSDYELGDAVSVTRLPGAESVTLTQPDGTSTILLPIEAPRAFTVNKPGLYKITQAVKEGRRTVNKTFTFFVHTSDQESDTGFDGGALISAEDTGAPNVGEGNGAIEIWLYLAIALLIVMMTEWWVYYREQY